MSTTHGYPSSRIALATAAQVEEVLSALTEASKKFLIALLPHVGNGYTTYNGKDDGLDDLSYYRSDLYTWITWPNSLEFLGTEYSRPQYGGFSAHLNKLNIIQTDDDGASLTGLGVEVAIELVKRANDAKLINSPAPVGPDPVVLSRSVTPEALISVLVDGILANPEGGTVWLKGTYFSSAFLVGGVFTHTLALGPDGTGTKTQVVDAVTTFVEALNPGIWQVSEIIGWWINNGTLYIDAGTTFDDLHKAAFAALTRCENAIGLWVNNKYEASIPLKLP